jgi:hypothetical protein
MGPGRRNPVNSRSAKSLQVGGYQQQFGASRGDS